MTQMPDEKTRWENTRTQIYIVLMHFLAIAILAIAMFPMVYFFISVWKLGVSWALWQRVLAFCFAFSQRVAPSLSSTT